MNPLLRLLTRDFLFIGKNIVSEKLVSEKRVGFYWPKNPFPHIFSNQKDQYFKKSLICAGGNRFLQFFQILVPMEAVFQSIEILFCNEFFILVSGNGFSVNYKPCTFI